ncbi:hypothetical protein F5Y10DRAFT_283971 [Nemania abortiva]|nr:hypothetical protein F5Y10DRAFT_283971 [Nemania abortiva]
MRAPSDIVDDNNNNAQSKPAAVQTHHHPTAGPYPEVAASNPEHTTRLWKAVMSSLDDTASERDGVESPSLTEGVLSETTAKVTDVDFAELVLQPHGITIDRTTRRDLRKHFNIMELPNDPEDRLNVYKMSFALSVWLEPDTGRIRENYIAMRKYRSNEAEYSASALRDIFLDEPLRLWLLEDQEGEKFWLPVWLPVRLLQFACKPPQDEWHTPPPIYPLRKRYEWDIRPDCAYYVSLRCFKLAFREDIQYHTSVVQQRAFGPYLTIEFKEDLNSLAVASAMALYNRYRLKHEALRMSSQGEWSEEDKNQMRHYGIKFVESYWTLWCTVPKAFPEWTGCTMSRLSSGSCCAVAGLRELVSVVNDIHYWGLQVHGKSCKADIYTRVRSHPDADLIDTSILEDDSNRSVAPLHGCD